MYEKATRGAQPDKHAPKDSNAAVCAKQKGVPTNACHTSACVRRLRQCWSCMRGYSVCVRVCVNECVCGHSAPIEK